MIRRINVLGATGELWSMCKIFEKEYPSYTVWLERDHNYEQRGRFENEIESNRFASYAKSAIKNIFPNCLVVKSSEYDCLFKTVRKLLP
jgi:hypothetical protein